MSMTYDQYGQPSLASTYSFRTKEGEAARFVVPTRLNLTGHALIVEFDHNSSFRSAQQLGSVSWGSGQLTLSFTANEVNTMRDGFYRVKATKDGRPFYILEGNINYEMVTNSGNLLDADGKVKDMYLPPLSSALDEVFLPRDEYVAGVVDPEILSAAVDGKLSSHINADTPHPAYDIDAPSFKLIFENGLI